MSAAGAPLGFVAKELARWPAWREALAGLEKGSLGSVKTRRALRPALYAGLAPARGTLLVVASTSDRAAELAAQVADYTNARVAHIPGWGFFSFEPMSVPATVAARRCRAVCGARAGDIKIVTAAVSALMQVLPAGYARWCDPFHVRQGISLDMHLLLEWLVEKGYASVDLVQAPGQFARRGGMIDVFPAQADAPARIELFGDTCESLRLFSADDQLTKGHVPEIVLYPATESGADEAHSPRSGGSVTLQTVLAPSAVVIDEPKEVTDATTRYWDRAALAYSQVRPDDSVAGVSSYYMRPEVVGEQWQTGIGVGEFGLGAGPVELPAVGLPPVPRNPESIAQEIGERLATGWRVTMVTGDEHHRRRVAEALQEAGIAAAMTERTVAGKVNIVIGEAEQGYAVPEARLAVYGLSELALRHARRPQLVGPARKKALIEFRGIKPGDLLVHELHGIAAFQGLVSQSVAGVAREYIMLAYAGSDKLYLPTDQLAKVSRYVGPAGDQAKITRLGSPQWIRSKTGAGRAVKKLAIDLLALYADRLKIQGYAYPPDTEWQREMELAFPYEETPGQLTVIDEVKHDLESASPMDRLVCGDVGYGKTEVALRAAFKVALEGKQVMVMAPTTVLAEQHFLAFSERFAPYPIKVAMLSRFLRPKERAAVVAAARLGKIDILIGTHRVLQKDISFPDLGLLIIDEEQRFGVGHKERLREAKKDVDVLTLSATPIPRTLQMSMSGVRDLSVIDTPPRGRLPVLTYVGEYDVSLIREAITRELDRGGQVFYLHNNVSTMAAALRRVANLAPEATIGIAHGQMGGPDLEKVMLAFYHGDLKILLCTSIIESGLDIANANTLVVEEADRLGLAQMYQIRGRVGRQERQAFAYFTYPANRVLSEGSALRLKTVAEFTELGSGLNIALRDLEIRGAGDLVGPDQHGQMAAVGFDLYCQMLREAVDELQGRVPLVTAEVRMDIPVAAYLPDTYVVDEDARLEFYRGIATADRARLAGLEAELRDRFGPLPEEARALLEVAGLRLTAASAGIRQISLKDGRLAIQGIQSLSGDVDLRPVRVEVVKYNDETAELSLRLTEQPKDIPQFIDKLLSAIIPAGVNY